MRKILIPKDFYENKGSLTPNEILYMVGELVKEFNMIEDDRVGNFEWAIREMEKNRELEANNQALKDMLLKKDIEIIRLKEQLQKEVSA